LTFDIEGMGALNGDLSKIELYYRLGARQMLIAYNLNNDAGGGPAFSVTALFHERYCAVSTPGSQVAATIQRIGSGSHCPALVRTTKERWSSGNLAK
jgi:microsomal dipeptidase-like Zn-dependent dipeptidase